MEFGLCVCVILALASKIAFVSFPFQHSILVCSALLEYNFIGLDDFVFLNSIVKSNVASTVDIECHVSIMLCMLVMVIEIHMLTPKLSILDCKIL